MSFQFSSSHFTKQEIKHDGNFFHIKVIGNLNLKDNELENNLTKKVNSEINEAKEFKENLYFEEEKAKDNYFNLNEKASAKKENNGIKEAKLSIEINHSFKFSNNEEYNSLHSINLSRKNQIKEKKKVSFHSNYVKTVYEKESKNSSLYSLSFHNENTLNHQKRLKILKLEIQNIANFELNKSGYSSFSSEENGIKRQKLSEEYLNSINQTKIYKNEYVIKDSIKMQEKEERKKENKKGLINTKSCCSIF